MREVPAPVQGAQEGPGADVALRVTFSDGAGFGSVRDWRLLHRYLDGEHPLFPAGAVGTGLVAAAALDSGAVLRVWNYAGSLYVQRVERPWLEESWSLASVSLILAAGAGGVPGVAVRGDTVRVYYAVSGPKLMMVESVDGGQTWGSAVVVRDGTGGAATSYGMVFAGYDPDVAGWWSVYNYYDAGGLAGVSGGNDPGSGWSDWDDEPGDLEVVGAAVWPGAAVLSSGGYYQNRIFVYLLSKSGWSVISFLGVTFLADGSFELFDDNGTVDEIGTSVSRMFRNVSAGNVGDAALLVVREESGDGSYFGVAFCSEYPSRMAEPVLYPGWDVKDVLRVVEAGGRGYLVGDWIVVVGEAVEVDPVEWEPVAYRYEQIAQGGGRLEITLPAGAQPRPWQRLRLVRTVAGCELVSEFRIMSVRRGRGQVRVVAYDATGALGQFVARRPWVFRKQSGHVVGAARRLVAWAGLESDVDSSGLQDVYFTVESFVWRPGETGLSALLRLLRRQQIVFRPDSDGFGVHFAVAPVARRVFDSSGNAVADYGRWHVYGEGGQPVADVVLIEDASIPGLAVMFGLFSSDPEDGEAWRVADGYRFYWPPRPTTYTNRFMDEVSGELKDRAEVEGDRLARLAPVAEVVSGLNLGLELFDVVTVNGQSEGFPDVMGRAIRIVELWKDGRLVQRVLLGALDE